MSSEERAIVWTHKQIPVALNPARGRTISSRPDAIGIASSILAAG